MYVTILRRISLPLGQVGAPASAGFNLSYFFLFGFFLVVFHVHHETSKIRDPPIFDYKSYSFFCRVARSWPKLPGKIVLSIGMGIVVLLSIPLGYYNLDDNVVVQNAALVVIVISCLGKTQTSHHGRSTIRE